MKRRGQALVAAIMTLTVLTAGAIAIASASRLELRAAHRGVEQVQREAWLRSAVNRGVALLDRGRSDNAALLRALHQYAEVRWVPLIPEDPESPQIAIQLVDASSRFNLNTADNDTLRSLGFTEDAAKAIGGWIKEKSKADYSDGPRPYEPKRRPFDSIEELLLLHNIDPDRVFGSASPAQNGSAKAPPVSEWLSVFSGENNADGDGNARADANSAQADDLLAAANRHGSVATREQMLQFTAQRELKAVDSMITGLNSGRQRGQSSSYYRSVTEALRDSGIPDHHWGMVMDEWTVDKRSFIPAKVNVNTAPRAVLLRLCRNNTNIVDEIMKQRAAQPEGMDWVDLMRLSSSSQSNSQLQLSLTDSLATDSTIVPNGSKLQSMDPQELERLFCVRSAVYLVRCLVRERGSSRTDGVCATVYWPASPEQPAKIVQWRQPDRHPGWSAWYRPVREQEELTSAH